MINTLQLFCIILITALVCFLLFQLWFYIENYSYIVQFNETYKSLEFVNTSNINFIDTSVYDPNDSIFDVNYKWRCVEYNSLFYPISRYGFMSTDNISKNKSFKYLKDCIIDMFDTRYPIVYDPCIIQTSSDCKLLNSLL
jgi:hypothetical protein